MLPEVIRKSSNQLIRHCGVASLPLDVQQQRNLQSWRGIHPTRENFEGFGDRWAALEPIRAGARLAFGAFAKDVARGLTVRSDWGPQYIADAFGNELAWLGITHSHSFVREPQCNGVIERFIRTLKEQCIWLHRFESLEDSRVIIGAFIERYNHQWLIERLDNRTPVVARQEPLAAA